MCEREKNGTNRSIKSGKLQNTYRKKKLHITGNSVGFGVYGISTIVGY